MQKTLGIATLGFFSIALSAWAQSQPPIPPPAPVSSQLNLQLLGEALRTASTFHDLVKNMNIEGNLGVGSSAIAPGSSMSHTAAVIGAGAGAGAAIGELKGGQKGVVIGVIAGAAGALVIDQILRHRAETRDSVAEPAPEVLHRELKQRPALQQ